MYFTFSTTLKQEKWLTKYEDRMKIRLCFM